MDKLVHFTFYFIAALLGCMVLREHTKGQLRLLKAMGIVFVFCVIYGIIIEVFQRELTIDREGDIMDALANTLGALIGVGIIKILFSGKTTLKWKI
jgi:VanZ family protein